MPTTHLDYAEHSLNISKLNRQYYDARLKQDLESAYDISLKMLDEAMLLKQVTDQDRRINMAKQKN